MDAKEPLTTKHINNIEDNYDSSKIFKKDENIRDNFRHFMLQSSIYIGLINIKVSLGCSTGFVALVVADTTTQNEGNDLFLTQEAASWIAPSLALFMPVAGALSSYIMKKYGRRISLRVCSIPLVVSWILLANANNITAIITSRILQGITAGMYFSAAPTFISESASPNMRATLLGCLVMSNAVGKLLVHFIGSFIHWRSTSYICSILPITSLILLFFAPETPFWLASVNKIAQAKKNYLILRGNNERRRKEIELIILYRTKQSKLKPCDEKQKFHKVKNFISHFNNRTLRRSTLFAIIAMLAYQFSMIEILPTYVKTILSAMLIDSDDINFVMNLTDISRLVAAFSSLVFLKKVERRYLMIFGNSLTIISMWLISLYSYLVSTNYFEYSIPTWIPASLICGFVFLSTLCLGPMIYTIPAEVFSIDYKEIGGFITGSICCFFYSVSTKYSLYLFATLGLHGTVLSFSFIVLICSVILCIFLPETRGKELLEIEEAYCGDIINNLKENHIFLSAEEGKEQNIEQSM